MWKSLEHDNFTCMGHCKRPDTFYQIHFRKAMTTKHQVEKTGKMLGRVGRNER